MNTLAKIELLAETVDTVTISRASLDAIIEELEDAADRLALAELDAKEAALGPARVGARYLTLDEARHLWDGAAPLSIWRRKRGLSQRALAAKAGISPSYLAEIEHGTKRGSLDVLLALAGALDVEIGDLLPPGGITSA